MIKQSMVTPDKAHSPKRSNRSDMASSQLDLARAYVSAGVSVIPLKTDGTKAPALASWNEYRKRFAADDELRRWFRRPAGIGLVCGVQSNGLEVLDFDEDPVETMLEWAKILPEGLLDRLTIVATGGGGFHVPYRCESVTGNTKIAMAAEGGVLIESRGDGGYVVGVGSATGVHSSGKSYWQTAGEPLPSLPTVSADERKLMWMAAAELDERPDAADEFVRSVISPLSTASATSSAAFLRTLIAAFTLPVDTPSDFAASLCLTGSGFNGQICLFSPLVGGLPFVRPSVALAAIIAR